MSIDINWQPQNLKNEFVKLKPLHPSHFEDLYKVASDPLIWEQHPSFDRYKKEVFERWFKNAMASTAAFLTLETDNEQIIGSSRFYDYNAENATVTIGYTFLARKYWGTSINKSLKKLMIDYAFEQGIETVLFHIGATNVRSQKAVEKLGADKIKDFTKEDKGVKTYHVEFAIAQKNWNKTQQK